MTTRRTFLAGLLASAAIGPAQAVPAQPVAFLRPGQWVPIYFHNINAIYGKFGTGLTDSAAWHEDLRNDLSGITSLMRGAT